jgi:uncharacterized protein (DUF433 family)
MMTQQYVEKVENSYRVLGSRVWLNSIVHAYWNGQTAESIAQSFPGLTLEQVHGALAFYLSHRSEIDATLESARAEYDTLREASRREDPMFYQKLADARCAEQSARP